MALALRLFLLLLLAVALPARAAQAAPWPARGADLDRDLDYLELLVNDTLKILKNARDEPVGEGDLPSQPTSMEEPLGAGEGVSAGRISPTPVLDAAHKPSSNRRGLPTGKYKAAGEKRSHEPSERTTQILKEMQHGKQVMKGKIVLKALFPGESSGSVPAMAAGREAMPGTVTGDLDRDLDYLELLVNDTLKILKNARGEPVGEGDQASKPTSRTETQGAGDGTGVSARRISLTPLLDAAHKPSSHRRGPPRGRNKASGHKKPQEPSEGTTQILKEMNQGGQGERARKASPVAWLHEHFQPLEPPAGVTFPSPLLIAAHRPSSYRRVMKGKTVLKALFPGESRGSVPAMAAGREEMPGTVTGGERARKASPVAWLHEHFQPLEPPAGVTFPGPLLIAAHRPSSYRRDAAGTLTRAENIWKSMRRHFCWGTHCLDTSVAIVAGGALFLTTFFAGIWYCWRRKRSTSPPSQDQPKTSAWMTSICQLASPSTCPFIMPQLQYQFILVFMVPPGRRTRPSVGKRTGLIP